MSTRYTIPNRPEGRARRNIRELLSDFDEILAALNTFDGGNIRRESIREEAISRESISNIITASGTTRGSAITRVGLVPEMSLETTWSGDPLLVLFNANVRGQLVLEVSLRKAEVNVVTRAISNINVTGTLTIFGVLTPRAGTRERIDAYISRFTSAEATPEWVEVNRSLTAIQLKR